MYAPSRQLVPEFSEIGKMPDPRKIQVDKRNSDSIDYVNTYRKNKKNLSKELQKNRKNNIINVNIISHILLSQPLI